MRLECGVRGEPDHRASSAGEWLEREHVGYGVGASAHPGVWGPLRRDGGRGAGEEDGSGLTAAVDRVSAAL
ncbi:hypothetical protein [Microbispora sp. CA-102843]|uniref:hypothetical protein n=1 Tax=Microbispora sp. CA-102843 TaxID=3239952 RepID=UPI003D8D16E3